MINCRELGEALLFTVDRALRGVHVEDDRLRRFALVRTWSVQAPKNSLSATRFTVVSHSVSKRPGCPAGLSFCLRPRSHAPMDPDLENVIRQAVADAKAAGKDHLSQTELAVRAVQRVRPDMTASDALAAVNLMRRS